MKHRAGMVPGETVRVRGSGRLVTPSPMLPPKKVEPKRPRARVLRSLLTTVRTRVCGARLMDQASGRRSWPASEPDLAVTPRSCRAARPAVSAPNIGGRTPVPAGPHRRSQRSRGGTPTAATTSPWACRPPLRARSPGVVRACCPRSQDDSRVDANTRSAVSCGGSTVPVAADPPRHIGFRSGPGRLSRPGWIADRARGHVSRGTSPPGKPAPLPSGHGQAAGHSPPPAHRWISHPGNRRTPRPDRLDVSRGTPSSTERPGRSVEPVGPETA